MSRLDTQNSPVFSYPKSKISACLFEAPHQLAVERLVHEGFSVEMRAESGSTDVLMGMGLDLSLIGIRSKTKLRKEFFAQSKRLLAAGLFCIGTDQVDLAAAARRGVAVFNAPYSNTRSVSELAIGMILCLSRKITDQSASMHRGDWQKVSGGCFEIRGKTLGIVGYGSIGAQLSVLAEAMGMRVLFFDLEERLALGNAERVTRLEELLVGSDIVSLHLDARAANTDFFGAKEFRAMKKGALFLNLARGQVVNEQDLVAVLQSGHLSGAAVDVFKSEPAKNGPGFVTALQGMKNVILTPHIGGSTTEAQRGIAEYVSQKLIDYVNTGSTAGCANLPQLQLPVQDGGHRFLHIHKNVPGVIAQINQVLARYECNVMGQYLKTQDEIGYVITDVDREYDQRLTQDLRSISETIRFRVLY